MDLREYQLEALRTDIAPRTTPAESMPDGKEILVPLLGLAGEVGSLLAEYKKHLRDGKAHLLFKEEIAEELGDLLWYVANVASKFDLNLGDIATSNLKKTQHRWPSGVVATRQLFDESCPECEQLPRKWKVLFKEETVEGKVRVRCWMGPEPVGDPLTDNAYENDGYRFHDVFHLAFATFLGWSPIMRSLLKRKRKSDPQVDEVEDGARAKVVEEAVSAIVYDYARKHNYLDDVQTLDYSLLKTIQGVVSDREARVCTPKEWQETILGGYTVWRQVWKNRGGIVIGDLIRRTLAYLPDPAASKPNSAI